MSPKGGKTAPTKKTTKVKARPVPSDHQKVGYQDIRDDFLQRLPKEDESEVEWLVQVGAFVQHCWLAEEHARRKSDKPEELDEVALWDLWDNCSSGQLETMQVEALGKLDEYRKGRTVEAFGAYAARKFQPVGWLVFSVSWLALQLWKGFVSGIGLILLGLLIAVAAPEAAKKIRGTVDTMLPEATRPLDGPVADAQAQDAETRAEVPENVAAN